jgi:hypothetical protein
LKSPAIFVSILAAYGLGACAAPGVPPERHGTESGTALAPARSTPAPATAAPEMPASVQDYSPLALFSEAHADFLAKRDRFEPSFVVAARGLLDGNLNNENGDFDMGEVRAEGMAPIVIDPDSVLLFGGKALARRYEMSSDFRGGVEDQTVQAYGANIGLGHFFSTDTYAEAVFSPGVYSDFDGTLHSDDWQFFGRGLLTYRLNEDVFVKGGVEVTQVFEDVPVYPLLGISAQFHPAWRTDILLPRKAELSFLPTDALTIFGQITLDGDEFRVRSSSNFGKRPYSLQTQELAIYFGGSYRFTDNLSLYAKIGSVIAGDHRFQDPTGVHVEGQIEPALAGEVGIGWDF